MAALNAAREEYAQYLKPGQPPVLVPEDFALAIIQGGVRHKVLMEHHYDSKHTERREESMGI